MVGRATHLIFRVLLSCNGVKGGWGGALPDRQTVGAGDPFPSEPSEHLWLSFWGGQRRLGHAVAKVLLEGRALER